MSYDLCTIDVPLQPTRPLVCVCLFKNTGGTERPVLLIIGNKTDLEQERTITRETGAAVAREAKALFGECSAKTGEGVNEVRTVTTACSLYFYYANHTNT